MYGPMGATSPRGVGTIFSTKRATGQLLESDGQKATEADQCRGSGVAINGTPGLGQPGHAIRKQRQERAAPHRKYG